MPKVRKVIRRARRAVTKAAGQSARDPFGSYAPSLPTVGRSIGRAARHPSPRNLANAVLTSSAVTPLGTGPVGKAGKVGRVGRAAGYARSAEEVFRANKARTAATRATRLRAVEIPAARARAAATVGRSAEVARESATKTIRAIRSGSPSRSSLVKSVRAGAAAGGVASISSRVKSKSANRPAPFHPLTPTESPAEGLRKVAAVSERFGPAGRQALIEGQAAARSAFYAPGGRGMSSSQKATILRVAVGAAFARNLKDERRKMLHAAALRVTRQ